MLRIALPDLISNSYFPAIAAVELGFFRAEGLDATVELIFPVPKTMEALRNGTIDFAAGAAHAPLMAFPEWNGAKLLMALAQRTYWFLVLRSDLHAARGDLSVLPGLRIGAAPGVDLALRQLLIDSHLDPETHDIRIAPVPAASGPPTVSGPVSFGVAAACALENGEIDGFWANGMGTEVAVQKGIGTVVLDVRRGDGPPGVGGYTFPAFVATENKIAQEPEVVHAAMRAVSSAQQALREDPHRATEVGRRLFPAMEAELIAELIRRDLPYYDSSITRDSVTTLNHFAQQVGLLKDPVLYEQVVANL